MGHCVKRGMMPVSSGIILFQFEFFLLMHVEITFMILNSLGEMV